MLKNNLIVLLNSFSKKEMTRFLEFVESPYHNKHKEVRALLVYLNRIYPHFNEKKCDRHRIFKALYPNQKHHQANLALLFTYAFRLAKKFLSVETFNASSDASFFLLAALRDKQHHHFYQKELEKSQKQLLATPYRDINFYYTQYEWSKEADLGGQLTSWKGMQLDFSERQERLDYFYLAEKLKAACELQVRKKILKAQFDLEFIERILVILKKDWSRFQQIPPIAVYYHLYQLITSSDDKQYYKALPIIAENSSYFPKKELQDIYTYIQNYCIKQINEGKANFMEELLEIYKIQLQQGLLLDEKNELSEWHYKNIVTLGLRLKDLEWTDQFIEKHQTQLSKASRDNAYRFNRAAYAYEIADYDRVLQLLLQVEYTNIQYGLGARWILLRTYFELEEATAFFALCDSFRLYLQRNQLISDFKKKGNEQAIRFVRKIFQVKLEAPYQRKAKNKAEILKLKQELAATRTIFNKGWLEKKLMEMG